MELYAEIARMGIPTMLRTSLMSISTITINRTAATFGDAALAAISVANKSLRFVGSAVMGFGQGFQPIAGFCWGAKKYKRVKKAFYLTSLIGVILCATLGTFLFVFAKQAITIFTPEVDVLDIGMLLIRSQCVVLPMHVWVMIATGLFQALGKPFQAGFLGLCRQAFSLIPCVLILTYMFGLTGLSVAQAASDVVSFCFALAFVIPMIKEINNLRNSDEAVE
jgi:Na+-driven multidrug efflux pump